LCKGRHYCYTEDINNDTTRSAYTLTRNAPEGRSATFMNAGTPFRHFLQIQNCFILMAFVKVSKCTISS